MEQDYKEEMRAMTEGLAEWCRRRERRGQMVRRVLMMGLLLVTLSALAMATSDNLRRAVFHPNSNQPSVTPPPVEAKPPVVRDTVAAAPDTTTARHTARLQPIPHLTTLTDTSPSTIPDTIAFPCGCPDGRKDSIGNGAVDCDYFDTFDEPEPEEPAEVTITVNRNIVTVEGADNETVSVFDDHGRLVAITQCNGQCSIVLTPETMNSRVANPAPHWVQVGSRPLQRVYIYFPPSRTVGIW